MTKAKTKSKKKEEVKDSVEEKEQLNDQQNENAEIQEEELSVEELSVEDQLRAELDESKDKHLRLYSEFENFRRRTAKEKLELVGTANERLLESLLPVLDDFERADKSFDEKMDIKTMKEGIDLIFNKFKNALDQKGVKKMDVDKGSDFDPEFHEAITQIPAPEKSLKGKVVDVIENGYLLSDKVIRFAKVVTGS